MNNCADIDDTVLAQDASIQVISSQKVVTPIDVVHMTEPVRGPTKHTSLDIGA